MSSNDPSSQQSPAARGSWYRVVIIGGCLAVFAAVVLAATASGVAVYLLTRTPADKQPFAAVPPAKQKEDGVNIVGGGGGLPSTPSTEDLDRTLAWMAAEVKKANVADAKNNQFASETALKEMQAELAKIERKVVKWKFQVAGVTRDIFGKRVHLVQREAAGVMVDFNAFAEDNPPPVDAQGQWVNSRNTIEIGKVVSAARAKRLAAGDSVTITGKVHVCQPSRNYWDGIVLCLKQAKVIE